MGGGGVISVRTGAGAGQFASSSAVGQQVDPYPPPHGVERVGGSGGKCLVCGKVRLIFSVSTVIFGAYLTSIKFCWGDILMMFLAF